MTPETSEPKRIVTRLFLESLHGSVVGEQTRGETFGELIDVILAGWDGKRPVSAQPLYEQLERIHGKDIAAAAALDLKVIAEKHAILVDLPAHLKTLRLQERQELSARYHPRPIASTSSAATVSEGTAPASNGAATASAPASMAGKVRARPLGIPAAAALVLLVAYLISRVFWFEELEEPVGQWSAATLPADAKGLPCASVRAAGPILECTLLKADFDAMARADFAARAAVTQSAVVASGKVRLRVRTDDGVMRGAF